MKERMLGLIKVIEKTVRQLSDDEIQALLAGEGKLSFVEIKKRQEEVHNNMDWILVIIDQLKDTNTRDEASLLLMKLKKKELISLAKEYHIHILKSDTKKRIMEKIIETIVGAKLRHNAINTMDVKFKKDK